MDALCEWIALSSDSTVVGAFGPDDVVEQAGSIAPDAILPDMEMDGFDTADRLGLLGGTKPPALLALTGNARLCQAPPLDARFSATMLKQTDLSSLLSLLERVPPAH